MIVSPAPSDNMAEVEQDKDDAGDSSGNSASSADSSNSNINNGRQFIESRLRQEVFVVPYPDDAAGAPVADSDKHDPSSGYQNYHNEVSDNEANPYAPFQSRLDWEIARWAKLRGPGSTAFTELLSIKGVQQALGLSYKNTRELNRVIDTKLPTVRPRFQRAEVVLGDTPHILYYRDVLTCIRALFWSARVLSVSCFQSGEAFCR